MWEISFIKRLTDSPQHASGNEPQQRKEYNFDGVDRHLLLKGLFRVSREGLQFLKY